MKLREYLLEVIRLTNIFVLVRSDHIQPGEGRVASGDTGDIGNAKNILQHSPKAIFRILNKGIYYNYTNEIYRK